MQKDDQLCADSSPVLRLTIQLKHINARKKTGEKLVLSACFLQHFNEFSSYCRSESGRRVYPQFYTLFIYSLSFGTINTQMLNCLESCPYAAPTARTLNMQGLLEFIRFYRCKQGKSGKIVILLAPQYDLLRDLGPALSQWSSRHSIQSF